MRGCRGDRDRPGRRYLALTVLLAATVACARAEQFGRPNLKSNAFGTPGAVYPDSAGLTYRRSIGQGDGARAGELDLGTDSLLGWRIERVTPYALYSVSDSFGGVQSPGLPPLPMFAPHMDLKAQIDRVWLHQSALIFDSDAPPPGHDSMTVAGIALNFAF